MAGDRDCWDLAVLAARTFRPWVLPFDERCTVAFEGIAEAFALGADDRGGLIAAGLRAIAAETTKYRSFYGLPGNGRTGKGTRFAVYWRGAGRHSGMALEERITDRLAVFQVWPLLTSAEQRVLAVAAAISAGDATPASAARLAGYTDASNYRHMLTQARAHARRLWFDHESDPGHYQHHRRRKAA